MLKLYDRELSGNAYKVRLLLALLDLPCERIPVTMKDGRNEVDVDYLRLNPRGQIPTLVDGDAVLWGSTAILCYLARRYDPGDRWLPAEPQRFAAVMQWLELAQNEVLTGLARARALLKFGLAGDLEAAQQLGRRALRVLETRLATEPWLAGAQPTLADIACFPYAALAGEGQVDLAPYPGVRRWIAAMTALPGFVGMPGIEAGGGR
jgi:glutathione S-transferase